MVNKRKLDANIERLKDSKREHLSKMDEAERDTEEKHYRMLSRKNQKMIDYYREKIEEMN